MVKGVVVFDIDGTLLGGGCSDFDIEYSKNQIRQLVATALKNDDEALIDIIYNFTQEFQTSKSVGLCKTKQTIH